MQQQAARREAEQANRMKDEFLSMVSHELQSPLVAILQAKLIQDMLDISRILVDRLSLTLQSIELVPVVESAIATLRPNAEEKGVEIDFRLTVLADSDRLHQVFVNILTNAVKFTPAGGR